MSPDTSPDVYFPLKLPVVLPDMLPNTSPDVAPDVSSDQRLELVACLLPILFLFLYFFFGGGVFLDSIVESSMVWIPQTLFLDPPMNLGQP